jgi:hypothetical protein
LELAREADAGRIRARLGRAGAGVAVAEGVVALVLVASGVVTDRLRCAQVIGVEVQRLFRRRGGAGEQADGFGDEVAAGGEAEVFFEGTGAREGAFVEAGGEVGDGGGVAAGDAGAVGGVVEVDRGGRVWAAPIRPRCARPTSLKRVLTRGANS